MNDFLSIVAIVVSIFAVYTSWQYHLKATISDHLLNKAQEVNQYVYDERIRGLNTLFGISSIVSTIIAAEQILGKLEGGNLGLKKKQLLIDVFYLSLHVSIRKNLWEESIIERVIDEANAAEEVKGIIKGQVKSTRRFLEKSK